MGRSTPIESDAPFILTATSSPNSVPWEGLSQISSSIFYEHPVRFMEKELARRCKFEALETSSSHQWILSPHQLPLRKFSCWSLALSWPCKLVFTSYLSLQALISQAVGKLVTLEPQHFNRLKKKNYICLFCHCEVVWVALSSSLRS